jgi:hypothetical protein
MEQQPAPAHPIGREPLRSIDRGGFFLSLTTRNCKNGLCLPFRSVPNMTPGELSTEALLANITLIMEGDEF